MRDLVPGGEIVNGGVKKNRKRVLWRLEPNNFDLIFYFLEFAVAGYQDAGGTVASSFASESSGEAVGVGDAAEGFVSGGDLGGRPIYFDKLDADGAKFADRMVSIAVGMPSSGGVPNLANVNDTHQQTMPFVSGISDNVSDPFGCRLVLKKNHDRPRIEHYCLSVIHFLNSLSNL